MIRRARIKRERNYNASKLTLKEVAEIRGQKGMKQHYLGRKYGVGQQTISQIQRRKTWKNVGAVKHYGKELVLDLFACNNKLFTRKKLKEYFEILCNMIDMKREKLVFWDDVGVPIAKRQTAEHTKGTTAVQFILTSNITIHTLDLSSSVYINIFSCKDFDHILAKKFSVDFFECKNIINVELLIRG